MTTDKQTYPCPRCNGTGFIRTDCVPLAYERYVPVYDTTSCWQCGGKGRI